MGYVDRPNSYSIGALAAIGGGYALSRFVGAVAWVPTILGIGSFVILKKLIDRNPAVIAALAGLIAQTGWFVIGVIAMPELAPDVILDIVVNCILFAALI